MTQIEPFDSRLIEKIVGKETMKLWKSAPELLKALEFAEELLTSCLEEKKIDADNHTAIKIIRRAISNAK